ncbi:putative FAD-linked oxidoreductase YvdP [compost metagenome]
MVSFVAYGGAIGQIPPDSTAFVHRKALFVMQYQTYWEQDELALRNIEWVEQFRESMLPYTHGAYCNYCDSLISDWPNLYFGVNIARLKHIKQAYDPENLFRFEQSIPLQSE